MDNALLQHVSLTEEDRTPDAPLLQLFLESSNSQSTTLPISIDLRLHMTINDGHDRPCILDLSPIIHGFSPSGFVLFHRLPDGSLEEVKVDRTGLIKVAEETGPIVINGWNQSVWELAPGGDVKVRCTLPERYHKALKPGEMYAFLWPGNEIARWDWGTIREHMGLEVKSRSTEEALTLPRLILSGGAHVSFTVHLESNPWPIRSEREEKVGFALANLDEQRWRSEQAWKASPADRNRKMSEQENGAPKLQVTLEGHSTVIKGQIYEVTVKVSINSSSSQRPILFHIQPFHNAWERLYRRRKEGGEWEECDSFDTGNGCFLIVDDPDIVVYPARDENFASLKPGETWTTTRRLHVESWIELSEECMPGDTLRYHFDGTEVDWWDWGTPEEHAETTVKLPCFINGLVIDPWDNGGRPKLLVAPSEPLEFVVGESLA